MNSDLIKVLFPTGCVGCRRWGHTLCPKCFEQIEFLVLPIKVELKENFLDELRALAVYQPPISNLIQAMKYQGIKELGGFLGQMLYETGHLPPVDQSTVISAVPLHTKRQKQRMFNQAEEIGLKLAELTDLPFALLLKRARDTPHQAALTDRNLRLSNLLGSLVLSQTGQKLVDQNQMPQAVWLIDDVTTTGTTLNECARVLKLAGVKKVVGLTVAHGS